MDDAAYCLPTVVVAGSGGVPLPSSCTRLIRGPPFLYKVAEQSTGRWDREPADTLSAGRKEGIENLSWWQSILFQWCVEYSLGRGRRTCPQAGRGGRSLGSGGLHGERPDFTDVRNKIPLFMGFLTLPGVREGPEISEA